MSLQEQAEKIVDNLHLLDIISKYGEGYLVGNVALKTTIKPDIDMLIYLENDKWDDTLAGLKNDFKQLLINDYEERFLKESRKYLITFKHQDGNTVWSIDITLSEKTSEYITDSYKFYLDYKDKFTAKIIDIILPLKQYFHDQQMLRNSMSYFIYRAVIDEHAKTPEDIFNYLQKNKINIERFRR